MNKLLKTTSVTSFFVSVLTVLLLANGGCSSSSDEAETLKIAVSADMRFTMDSIVKRFEKKTGIPCEVISGSSGILATQIKKGAPYDLYFSANEQFAQELYNAKLTQQPQTFARGQLVFVYTGSERFSSVKDAITHPQIRRVGQADEIGAPYGKATTDYIHKVGLNTEFRTKKIVGESIEQVNHFLESNAVDAIFTSYSFVKKHPEKYNYMVIDAGLYPEIRQSVAVISKGGKMPTVATKKFMDYFQSSESNAIITHFGYLVEQ
jgi:molybdate transport system substrate-binding protein